MPNIQTVNPNTAGAAGPILESVKKQMGSVPNIFATLAHSPATLEGFLAFSGALGTGELSASVREQIALAVAGLNQCDYCASAHTLMAVGAGVDQTEASNNLRGKATDPRTQAILDFVSKIINKRGDVPTSDVNTLRESGVSNAELVEILAHIAINIFTNYFNHVAQTEIDFPFVSAQSNS